MESYVLQWPREEKWKITHSSVEGDGRTIFFALTPEKPSIEGEVAFQYIWLPREKPDLDLDVFFENWLGDVKENKQAETVELLPLELPYPSKVFLMNHISPEQQRHAGLGFMVAGEESILLHVNQVPAEHFSPVALDSRLEYFKGIQIKEQRLEDSLVESGLIPPKETVPALIADEAPLSDIVPDYLKPFAHPMHPEDFPYWEISYDHGRKELFWARILKEVEEGLFVAMKLRDPDARSLYLYWDKARECLVEISTEGLSLKKQLEIMPCEGCKFQSVDPAILQKNEQFPPDITCPFCGGQIKIIPQT